MKKLIVLALLSLTVFNACKKDTKTTEPTPEPPASTVNDPGTVAISYNATFGNDPLVYNTNYVTANGDTMKVTKFTYYISNVVLTKDDNSKYVEPNSYHLINHSTTGNKSFTLTNVPAGKYKSITFLIGVDSVRNVSGVQDGDLKPSLNMFWDWSTGYIMLKMEASSPQAINSMQDITYHVGGFAYPNSCIRSSSITFGQDLEINKTKSPQLKIKTDLSEMFKNPVTVNFANLYYVMTPGNETNMLANNYKDMFSFQSITP
jgi:hypothetical protein